MSHPNEDEQLIQEIARHAEKDLQEELEQQEHPSHWKRHFKRASIFTVGVLMVFLMLSFTVVTFPIADIIRGQLESNPLENNIIELDEFTIIFASQTLDELQTIYFNTQETEFSVCLSGEKTLQGDYFIDELYVPTTHVQTFNHVSFEPCDEETLIMLHSHPYKSCLASDTDLNTLEKTKVYNPDILMVVMCEPARFSIYS